jgi:S-adenosylmethionine hydrolase
MKKLIVFLFLFLFLTSCVSATAEVELCKTDKITYADLGFQRTVLQQAVFNKDVDISDQIRKIDEFGTVSISITESSIRSIAGDLGWVHSILIEVVKDGNTVPLSQTTVSSNQERVDIHINDSVNISELLHGGKFRLRYTIVGTVPTSFKINNNVCFGLKAQASKNL